MDHGPRRTSSTPTNSTAFRRSAPARGALDRIAALPFQHAATAAEMVVSAPTARIVVRSAWHSRSSRPPGRWPRAAIPRAREGGSTAAIAARSSAAANGLAITRHRIARSSSAAPAGRASAASATTIAGMCGVSRSAHSRVSSAHPSSRFASQRSRITRSARARCTTAWRRPRRGGGSERRGSPRQRAGRAARQGRRVVVEDEDARGRHRGRHPALFLQLWMRRQLQGAVLGRLPVGRLVVISVARTA